MNSIRFSVLIPVYNVEKYLRKCLDSVMNQTYTDYEVILIDDGSTDSSGYICEEYQEKYPDIIRLKRRGNKGVLLTRVEEIQMSKGEYLIFVDSDDWVSADLLKRIDETIRKYNSDLVIYNFQAMFSSGKSLESGIELQHDQIYNSENKRELYQYFISTNRLNTIWCKAVKREIVDVETDYPLPKVTIGEDVLQSLPLLTRAKNIIYINDVLYYYRKDVESVTGRMRLSYLDSFAFVNKSMLDYMQAWGIETDEIKTFKANELAFYINSYLRLLCYDDEVLEAALDRLRNCESFVTRQKEVHILDFENKRIGFRVKIISTWICQQKYSCVKLYLGVLNLISRKGR